ncbi:hypothetical protein BBJ28_00025801 [Nothophytophthora sp. Chile5]|nr:hypothetical protein BBJ28_00025801 [Nothophytophthora sp. Chile5]
MLLTLWMAVGIVPLLLQTRSFLKFATPHKISEALMVPSDAAIETAKLEEVCPVEGLLVAGAWWNVGITHYYPVEHGRICHFVVPQYNIHGAYLLGEERTAPSSTTPASCSEESYPFQHYFYHGSIGYYAFYEEAEGTYCANDQTAYVRVRGLGTYDSNGASLAKDTGDAGYRSSYWYGLVGSIWITYRVIIMRRSYISCKRYGRRCDRMQQRIQRRDAAVYVHECLRLSAHGARNYQRAALLYLLLKGVMSDLFLLIAQDGAFAKVQYISLGYNLSGVLLMLFEMLENMNWLREKTRCLIKRLVFNYETALLGECLSAGLQQHFLTALNHSSLKTSRPTAVSVSYYIWSLVGHGFIIVGIATFVVSVRVVGALAYVGWNHRSWALLTAPCCVDTTLGVRNKMVMLGGYAWEDGMLCYQVDALASFGIFKMEEEDGAEFLVFRKLHWFKAPRNDLFVLGVVSGRRVECCSERSCTGIVSLFDRQLGGPLDRIAPHERLVERLGNKVSAAPDPLNVLPGP